MTRSLKATLVAAAVLFGAFVAHRKSCNPVKLRGGVRFEYGVDVDRGVEEERDRRYHALRGALAAALGIQPAGGPLTAEETRSLRARVDVRRQPGEIGRVEVEPRDPRDAAVVAEALRKFFPEVHDGDRSGVLVGALPAEVQASVRERAVREAGEVLSRRAAAYELPASVEVDLGPRLVFVDAAIHDARVLADIGAILGQPGHLAFRLVDDDVDLFAPTAGSTRPGDAPEGVSFQAERTPAGPGKTSTVHYARFVSMGPRSEALRRLAPWTATVKVGPDHVLGMGFIDDPSGGTSASSPLTLRTYHLLDEPILTGQMVESARIVPDSYTGNSAVLIKLSPEGAARFEAATERNVNRRFAIVLDGRVESAPVVQSKISGGKATLTMGADPEQSKTDAKLLELVLRTGALPAAVELRREQRLERSARAFWTDMILQIGMMAAVVIALILWGWRRPQPPPPAPS